MVSVWWIILTILLLLMPTFTVMQQCPTLLTLEDVDLDAQTSRKTNEGTRRISKTGAYTSEECVQACCDARAEDKCSIAVFQEGAHTCYLYECFPFKDCLTFSKSGRTLYFVDQHQAGTNTSTPAKTSSTTLSTTTDITQTTTTVIAEEPILISTRSAPAATSASSVATSQSYVLTESTRVADGLSLEAAPDEATTPAKPEEHDSTSTPQSSNDTSIPTENESTTSPFTVSPHASSTEAMQSSTYINNTGDSEQNTSTIDFDHDLEESSKENNVSLANDSDINSIMNSTETAEYASTTPPNNTDEQLRTSTKITITAIESNTSTAIDNIEVGIDSNDTVNNTTDIEMTPSTNSTDIEVTYMTDMSTVSNDTTVITNSSGGEPAERNSTSTPGDVSEAATVDMNGTHIFANETQIKITNDNTTTNITESTRSPNTTTGTYTNETEVINEHTTEFNGTNTTTVATIQADRNTTSMQTSSSTVYTLTTSPVSINTSTVNVSSSPGTMVDASTSNIASSSNITESMSSNNSVSENTTVQSASAAINNTDQDGNNRTSSHADLHFMPSEKSVITGALIAALSFGIIFFFSVLVLLGKRCYDGWQRRHYSRMDYLINGMYN